MIPAKNNAAAALRLALLALALVGTAACGIPDHSAVMRPGEDCLACHNGQVAPDWTVAGTVFSNANAPLEGGIPDAQILITDANKRTLTLTSNAAGNFYTSEMLDFPLHVEIQRGTWRMAMASSPSSGSCNSCHSIPKGNPDVPGRLFIPYQQLQ